MAMKWLVSSKTLSSENNLKLQSVLYANIVILNQTLISLMIIVFIVDASFVKIVLETTKKPTVNNFGYPFKDRI